VKIANIKIHNFKTFDASGISLTSTSLTTLIGENSVGKPNILEALDIFFNFSKSKISRRCFHHDYIDQEIIIEIKFTALTENELKKFSVHLDEEKNLTITQKIGVVPPEGKSFDDLDEGDYEYEENKHGTKWEATVEWAKLDAKPPTKTKIKGWWKVT